MKSKKKLAILLSSRISWSLVLLLIFKERVCALGTDFTDIDFLSRNKHYVEYCFQNVQKGCVRFGTDFTDIAF